MKKLYTYIIGIFLMLPFIIYAQSEKRIKTTCTENISAVHGIPPGRSDQTLWYDEPAAQWEETLPLGNGRLGMMPDGAINKEHIILNEISMWSGSEANYLNPDASRSLPEIRRLLFEGKNKEAQELMYTSFVPRKNEKGNTYGSFQMLGDLYLEHQYGEYEKDLPSDYRRWPITVVGWI